MFYTIIGNPCNYCKWFDTLMWQKNSWSVLPHMQKVLFQFWYEHKNKHLMHSQAHRRSQALLTKWQLTSIFDRLGCVQISDLYFTWDSGAQEVEEFSVLGVHDGSLDKLHNRVAAVLKLRVTPQAERPWRGGENMRLFFMFHICSLCSTCSMLWSCINHSCIHYETCVYLQ